MNDPLPSARAEDAGHAHTGQSRFSFEETDLGPSRSMQQDVALIRANALNIPLRTASVHCVVTSPPYWGLRCYGDDPRELGRESFKEYIDDIVLVAQEIWRVLKDDGLFWLNLGDTAAGSGGAGGDYNTGGTRQGKDKWKQGQTDLAPMQWCSLPHRIVHELQAAGWLLRADICWDKGQIRPEQASHVRRPRIAKEPIFMLAKSRKHVYYHEQEVEPGTVWHFAPSHGKKDSPAPFPDELPRRCILVSSRENDVVFDPFSGSGTTARVATELGRRGIGTDLYQQ